MALPESAPRPFRVPVTAPDSLATAAHEATLREEAEEFPRAGDGVRTEPGRIHPPDLVVAIPDPTIEQLLDQCCELRVRGNVARALARELIAESAALVEQMRARRSRRKNDCSSPDPG